METRNFALEVTGDYAMFTNPASKLGGEKHTYPVPTYGSLVGLIENVYWKPGIRYRIRRVRIMNKIRYESKCQNLIDYNDADKVDPTFYLYLKDVCYRIEGVLEFNENEAEFPMDQNTMNKHYSILSRSIEAGGRRRAFLGTSECVASITPLDVHDFEQGEGYYDYTSCDIGLMLHSLIYPEKGWDEMTRTHLSVALWHPQMQKGIINFYQPEECEMIRYIKPMKMRPARNKRRADSDDTEF